MKNQFLLLVCSLLFASGAAFSQCPVGPLCESVDLDFQTSGNGVNISHLPNWTYSHGSPSVSPTGFWLWSYNNGGEGINYSGYNFVAGQEYTICFVAETETHDGSPANPSATFNIVGTNAPVGGFNTTTSSFPIPAIPGGSQIIVSENWATYPNPGTGTYTYTFTAANNFNNLWFFPSSPTLPQVEIRITQLVICKVEPCDASFTVCLSDRGDGTSDITTSLNDANHTIVNMTIWEGGALVYNGPWVSYLGTNGKDYQICVTAVNNNTGEECKSCYGFCIAKNEIIEKMSGPGTLIHKEVLNTNKSSMDKSLIEKPLEKDLGISISPNPSDRLFEVATFADNSIATVSVVDMNSQEVLTKSVNGKTTSIDLKDQPSGIYIVKVTYNDGSISQEKIVLEK